MTLRKYTAIALLLATAIFAQALSAVDHVHLNVVSEQGCCICASASTVALLNGDAVPPVVPATSLLVEATTQSHHPRSVLDLRSRAPPFSLAS